MGLNHSPRIVTNGLVLCLDAANPKSYPGTGTTWFDLSGRGNNGTLTNGTSFSSANGGSMVFDGTDDYVQFTSTIVRTICFWGKFGTNLPNLAGLVCQTATGDNSFRASRESSQTSFRSTTSTVPANSSDFHFQYESSLMINGFSDLSKNINGYFIIPKNRTLEQDFYLGALGNGMNMSTISHTFNGRLYKGNVYAVFLYDRRLSNSELLQNFNALRGRFGI